MKIFFDTKRDNTFCKGMLKVKVKSLGGVRFFATPWTVAYQAPPSMGFSRQECWSGLPFPSPGDLPDLGIKPRSPTLQADALLSEPPGKCGSIQLSSLSLVRLFATPWTAVLQASLSITNSQSSLRLMSIKSMIPSNMEVLGKEKGKCI